MVPDKQIYHASSVLIDGRTLLIAGASGRGKSDLALRLIDRGARLVSDDYTVLTPRDGTLYASPPATIAGRMEVRGVGIINLPFVDEGLVALILNLDAAPVRLPDDILPATRLCGVDIPTLGFSALEMSAAIKAEQALLRHGLGVTS